MSISFDAIVYDSTIVPLETVAASYFNGREDEQSQKFLKKLKKLHRSKKDLPLSETTLYESLNFDEMEESKKL